MADQLGNPYQREEHTARLPWSSEQQQKLTREEFDRIASEIRDLVGEKMRNHKEGDAERLLLKRQ